MKKQIEWDRIEEEEREAGVTTYEDYKTVGELLSKVRLLEDRMKTLKSALLVAVTKGSSDSIVNEILTEYRKLEIGLNKTFETKVTIHK
ncbi:hypothetical protein [Priestia megaterium]|uniref:hypothetical protein n=1 Tax=Priestia megaterium TaxID=1404 RepID=UPI000BFC0F32|nr:hypothetical protein [Priestia megaterium]PGO60580.1 hypothetical protein CN981_08510 [Priestia megaterium]